MTERAPTREQEPTAAVVHAKAPHGTRAPRLPIVVGVAGHRDLVLDPADPGLRRPRDAVADEFRRLLEDYPSTPLIVLSGLAEGADTLAAEVAFALADDPRWRDPTGASRISFVAALPMPIAVCALDFDDPAHARRVETLAARSQKTLELWGEDEVRVDGLSEAARRSLLDSYYARLGAYISRHCHVLLALWNGRPPRPGTSGGTADVVSWFEHGAPERHLPHAPPTNPLRIVDGLRCIRIGCERRREPGFVAVDPSRVERERGSAHRVLAQIDEFNRDAERLTGAAPPESDVSASMDDQGVPGRACVDGYLGVQRAADAVARRFKASRHRTIWRLFGLAAVALLAFELFSHGPHAIGEGWARSGLLLLYVLAFAASMGIVERARRRHVEAKFLVYRSLAEALRVQCVWTATGLRDRVDDAYGVLHRDAIAWVRQGLKSLHVVSDGDPAPRGSALERLAWAQARWIDAQARWFREQVHRAHERLRRSTRVAKVLVLTGLALAAGYAVAVAAGHGIEGEDGSRAHDLHGALVIAMLLLVAAGGFVRAFGVRTALEATVDRYRAAAELFERAREAMAAALAAGDRSACESLVRALGREALAENVGWVLLNRDHPLEIVAGG